MKRQHPDKDEAGSMQGLGHKSQLNTNLISRNNRVVPPVNSGHDAVDLKITKQAGKKITIGRNGINANNGNNSNGAH